MSHWSGDAEQRPVVETNKSEGGLSLLELNNAIRNFISDNIELMHYTVWYEADPSTDLPKNWKPSWIDHDRKRIFL